MIIKKSVLPTDKSLINLDLLSISIRLKMLLSVTGDQTTIKIGNNTNLELTHKSTPIFKNVFNVNYRGLNIFELSCNPRGGLLDLDHAILKVKNEYLYTKNLQAYYYSLKKEMKFLFIRFCAVDIAADIEKTEKTDKWAYQFSAGKIDFVHHPLITVQHKKANDIQYIRIGSRNSDKFVRCYDKRTELKTSNKKYISDFWDKNGFNPDREVYRIELSLKGSIMHKILCTDFIEQNESGDNSAYYPFLNEKTIELIQNPQFLRAIYFKETDNFLKYYSLNEYAAKGKRAELCKKKSILKFNPETIIFHLERVKDKAAKMIHKIKILSKFLHQVGMETGSDLYHLMSEEIANFEGMDKWREKNLKRWTMDTRRLMFNPLYPKYITQLHSNFINQII